MKNLDYYLNLPYKIELKKIPQNQGGGWGAFMPELNNIAFFYGDLSPIWHEARCFSRKEEEIHPKVGFYQRFF